MKILSQVKPGAKVPKSLYKQKNSAQELEQYTTVTVKNGNKITLEYMVSEPGSFLK